MFDKFAKKVKNRKAGGSISNFMIEGSGYANLVRMDFRTFIDLLTPTAP